MMATAKAEKSWTALFPPPDANEAFKCASARMAEAMDQFTTSILNQNCYSVTPSGNFVDPTVVALLREIRHETFELSRERQEVLKELGEMQKEREEEETWNKEAAGLVSELKETLVGFQALAKKADVLTSLSGCSQSFYNVQRKFEECFDEFEGTMETSTKKLLEEFENSLEADRKLSNKREEEVKQESASESQSIHNLDGRISVILENRPAVDVRRALVEKRCQFFRLCPYCSGNHHPLMCRRQFDLGMRRSIIDRKLLCSQCLRRHSRECLRAEDCLFCGSKRHHSSLCTSIDHLNHLDRLRYS